MTKWARGFTAAVGIGWVVLAAAGIAYARIKAVPTWVVAPALAAFLIEYPFYLAPAFSGIRERIGGWRLPLFLLASAVLPYLAACGAGAFQWIGLAKVAGVALVLGGWFLALPSGAVTNLAFLCVVAALILSRFLDGAYPTPMRGVELHILGRLAVAHMAALALLVAGRIPETGYGFWPTRKEWLTGAICFLLFIPVGLPLALLTKAVHFRTPAPAWAIIGTFLGALWVIALFEEFGFRGVAQPMIERLTRSRVAALILTSLLYGLVHLSYGNKFPNWRWVLIAGLLGLFCGIARNRTGNIRAGMVTHALVVAVFRGFLAS
jgi:uncharacterized protein